MGTIIRTGDVMEIKPPSVFEVTCLGALLIPKPYRISLLDLQKPLKKIYVAYRISASKSLSTDSTKFVAGMQGINLGEFSGPNSHSAPANTDIHTCIPKNSILSYMILRFHYIPVDKKNKKFKGTFRDVSVELQVDPNKKLGDEYLLIEGREQVLLAKEHPFLFAFIYKKSPDSLKQIELILYSCVCEPQAKDIVKALRGELLQHNEGQIKINPIPELQNKVEGENLYASACNQNISQNPQLVYQDVNSMVAMPFNPYSINNQPANPYSFDNSNQTGQQFSNDHNQQAKMQQNPYTLQQPYQSMTRMAQQQPLQPFPQPMLQPLPQYPNQTNILAGQYPPIRPVQQMAPQITKMVRAAIPTQQVAQPIQENVYDDMDSKDMLGQYPQSMPATDDRYRQLQPSTSFYGKDYYTLKPMPQQQQQQQQQQPQSAVPQNDDASVREISAAQMRQNFATKDLSLSLGPDQVFSPPIVGQSTIPFTQTTPTLTFPNAANIPNAYTPVFIPPIQGHVDIQTNQLQRPMMPPQQQQALQLPQQHQAQQVFQPQQAQQPPQQQQAQQLPQQLNRYSMNPSGMIMGAPMSASHPMGSSSGSASTPSTGELDDASNPDKPVALVKPRKVIGVSVLPFLIGGMSPQLQTSKLSESDPEKKVQKNVPLPPIKSKPPNVLQKPTLITEKLAVDKTAMAEMPHLENHVLAQDSPQITFPVTNQLIMPEPPCQEFDEKIQLETNNSFQEGLGYMP